MESVLETVRIERYPAYKFSGAEWLGEIPEHWVVTKVKNVFRLVTEPSPKNNDFELLSVYTDIGVKPRKELEERGNKASTTDGYWFVKKRDIVVNKLLAWMGAIGVSNYDGVTSPAYDILRAKVQLESNFYHYLFRNEACISELKKHSRGIMDMRLRLYFDKFGDIMIPFPDFSEQQKIVSFLDRKTAQIDQAIGIKEKQIELLKERRQILIHRAVTRGLNPNAKLKDSGVEWIGKIPEHWKVSRLKNHIEMLTGFPFKSEKYTNVGIKLARGINVKEGVFNWEETRCWPKVDKHLERYLIKEGDILIAMDGSKVGKNFCKVKEEDLPMLLLQRVARLRPTSRLNSSFLFNHIVNRNFLLWVEMTKTDPMVPHIAPTDIHNFQITIPSLSEQKNISEYIEMSASKIAIAISLKEQEIEKLKEYKASLINSAVTGKIKVS